MPKLLVVEPRLKRVFNIDIEIYSECGGFVKAYTRPRSACGESNYCT